MCHKRRSRHPLHPLSAASPLLCPATALLASICHQRCLARQPRHHLRSQQYDQPRLARHRHRHRHTSLTRARPWPLAVQQPLYKQHTTTTTLLARRSRKRRLRHRAPLHPTGACHICRCYTVQAVAALCLSPVAVCACGAMLLRDVQPQPTAPSTRCDEVTMAHNECPTLRSHTLVASWCSHTAHFLLLISYLPR